MRGRWISEKHARTTRWVTLALLGALCAGCRSEEKRAVRAFCKAFEDCQPDNFAEEFDSVRDCTKESLETLERAEEENGPECKEAFTLAIECAAEVNADTCDFDTVVDECFDEIVDAFDRCPELDLETLELAGL